MSDEEATGEIAADMVVVAEKLRVSGVVLLRVDGLSNRLQALDDMRAAADALDLLIVRLEVLT